jgi:adenine-specific DNA-methyltransferase
VLLYNGIIADRRPESGNVLTTTLWSQLRKILPKDRQQTVVYGEACRLSAARLKELQVTFKQIPYDIGIR